MALSPKLELRHGQQLVMTPQLQQAIRLLQYSNVELNAFVDSELERNPLLERDERGEVAIKSSGVDAPEPADRMSSDMGETHEVLDLSQPRTDATAALDTEADNVYPDAAAHDMDPSLGSASWAGLRQSMHNSDGDDSNIEAYLSSEISLRDHLMEQLQLALSQPADRLIGQYLVDLIDEAGYLRADLDDLAGKLGCPLGDVEQVLSVIQTFDPAGVGARTLAECLGLQLKEQNRYDPQVALLLENLGLLAEHNITRLRKAVGVDMEELADMIGEIKRLSPKPGLKFGSVQAQTVVPEVFVRAAPDGCWLVELNADTLPRVLVNRTYFARVSKTVRNSGDKDYISECMQSANWLVKSLDQRARTILRVSEEIVRQQDAFFSYGVRHLRPLNLKTVAEAIKMHESTVSRVTSNKYIASPRGIFELKYFFTSSIASADAGDAHSSEAVRHRIKTLIDAENPQDILSDDTLVDRLKEQGIDIARRTVAKYREAMRIPSSVQRRREKQLISRMAKSA